MNEQQLNELLYQALETEIGGQQVYKTAIRCAQNNEVQNEWKKYLEETEEHERILRGVFGDLGLDPETQSPGRQIVHQKGQNLVKSMESALDAGDQQLAELFAAEAIVEAETKDHQNWELIGRILEHTEGKTRDTLKQAFDQVEEQEDEHLYHTMGWARELWIKCLGMPAVIPPPEEAKDVRSQIAAGEAEKARKEML